MFRGSGRCSLRGRERHRESCTHLSCQQMERPLPELGVGPWELGGGALPSPFPYSSSLPPPKVPLVCGPGAQLGPGLRGWGVEEKGLASALPCSGICPPPGLSPGFPAQSPCFLHNKGEGGTNPRCSGSPSPPLPAPLSRRLSGWCGE